MPIASLMCLGNTCDSWYGRLSCVFCPPTPSQADRLSILPAEYLKATGEYEKAEGQKTIR